jgi:hypothetical protein
VPHSSFNNTSARLPFFSLFSASPSLLQPLFIRFHEPTTIRSSWQSTLSFRSSSLLLLFCSLGRESIA